MGATWIAALPAAPYSPAFAGMFLGQWVRDKLPQEAFRMCFFGGLVVLGAYMAFRAWQLR